MSKAILYFFPGTCAQVTAIALEEVGVDYDLALADLRTPETRAAYVQINPKGKVPALSIEGRLLVENPAIVWFLDQRSPGRLFPESNDPFELQRRLADLAWCASGIHPMVRQVRVPQLWTRGELAGVVADGTAKLRVEAARVQDHLKEGGWWSPGGWSIVDSYLWWCFRNAQRGNMDLSDFPQLIDYLERIEGRPSTVAMIARQDALGVGPRPTSHQLD